MTRLISGVLNHYLFSIILSFMIKLHSIVSSPFKLRRVRLRSFNANQFAVVSLVTVHFLYCSSTGRVRLVDGMTGMTQSEVVTSVQPYILDACPCQCEE